MDPTLLILIALADGAKTADEILQIIRPYLNATAVPVHLQYLQFIQSHITGLTLPSPEVGGRAPAIRTRDDGRLELTTEGHVWLSDRPVIRFVVDRMNNLERNGLPRDGPRPAYFRPCPHALNYETQPNVISSRSERSLHLAKSAYHGVEISPPNAFGGEMTVS